MFTEAPYVGKNKFRRRFNNYKLNIVLSGKKIEKCLDGHLGTNDFGFYSFWAL